MKSLRYLFAAALVTLVAGCSKENGTDNTTTTSKTVVFTVQAEDTKAMISGTQTLWEKGDQISVFSDASSSTPYTFSTALGSPASSAEFSYTGDFATGEKYMALYPAASGISADFATSKISGLVIPANQTLGSNYVYATAYSTDGETLAFKNATSLVRFQVADGRVVSGALSVAEGKSIAGTFAATLDSDGIPTLANTADGASTINFDLGGKTKLSTGTDYYVAVAPTASSFSLRLQNAGGSYIEKTYEVSSLDRKKIYGVGDATSNNKVSKIVLNFNFADVDAMTDWPTAGNTSPATKTFTLNGTGYDFVLTHATGDSYTNISYLGSPSSGDKCLVISGHAQVGLPLISSFKLTKVALTAVAGGLKTMSAGITTSICGDTFDDNVQGGTTNSTAIPEWNLTDTKANTVYYIYQGGSASKGKYIKNLTLTYEKVTD